MDSMEIDDSNFLNKNFTLDSLIPRENSQQRKRPSRCVRVCVGLTLAVLLAGVVGQAVYYELVRRPPPGNPDDGLADQLRSTNVSLHGEMQELRVQLRNLTAEQKLLHGRLSALARDQDLLSTSHDELRREAERLQADNADLQRQNVNLSASLERQKKSQAAFEAHSESSAAGFGNRYELLQSNVEELNGSFQHLQRDMQQLQTNCTLLAAQLQNVKTGQSCQPGWMKLNESCYFFSASNKKWESSRQDCKSKGGDLVVINSHEEQAFINQLVPADSAVWIGLSDIVVEGTWTWVDGTPLTMTVWYPGQPNSHQGEQDCGELVQTSTGIGLWNDESCNYEQKWICEKRSVDDPSTTNN